MNQAVRKSRRLRKATWPLNHMAASGMTLIEAIIAVVLIAGGLFLITGWMDAVRSEAKRDLAIRLLSDLDEALARYRRATGFYPTSRGPDSAIPAIVDLLDHAKTRPILLALPASLWRDGAENRYRLVDPWGTPLRYFPPNSNDPKVVANEGHPLFESAGPDRDFGDVNVASIGDNIRSDDPGLHEYPVHSAVLEAIIEEEKASQKSNGEPDAAPTASATQPAEPKNQEDSSGEKDD